jgi:hypothetical protein
MTSTLLSANLTLKGPLIPKESLPSAGLGLDVECYFDAPKNHADSSDTEDAKDLFCIHLYDLRTNCVVLTPGPQTELINWCVGFLVVKVVRQEPLACRRVGAAMVKTSESPRLSWICGAEERVIQML